MIEGMKKQGMERGEGLPGVLVGVMVLFLVGAAFMIGRLSFQVEQLRGGTVRQEVKEDRNLGENEAQVTAAPAKLSVEKFKSLAKDMGLESSKFGQCLDEGKYAEKISKDLEYGADLGVTGTPTYFINGVMVVGARPQVDFEKVIDAEIKNGGGDKVVLSGSEKLERIKVQTGVGYVEGASQAKIKMVVFSEFECPYCGRAAPIEKALLEKYKGVLSMEFRHNPLPFHANAEKAAEAAECAGEQGKFWEMHDAIFSL
jgi:protein-disulfide isomerase